MRNLYDFPSFAKARAWLSKHGAAKMPDAVLPPVAQGRGVTVAEYLRYNPAFAGRPGQLWGVGDERITVISAGRGFGKNWAGIAAILSIAANPDEWAGPDGALALIIGPEPKHVLKKCIRPLIAACPPWMQPEHKKQEQTLFFPHPSGKGKGLEVRYTSSEQPRQALGDNCGFIWVDEFAHCTFRLGPSGQDFWEAADDALRVGKHPRALFTTTPTRIPQMVEMFRRALNPECPSCEERQEPAETRLSDLAARKMQRVDKRFLTRATTPATTCKHCGHEFTADVRLVTGATFDNRAHLSPAFLTKMERKAKTRIGEQEVYGKLLQDVPGQIISDAWIKRVPYVGAVETGWEQRCKEALDLIAVTVFVDPAKSSKEGSDWSGVAVVGITGSGRLFGLEDLSVSEADCEGRSPSNVWAPQALDAAQRWGATLVCETQGDQEVEEAIARAARLDAGRQGHVRSGHDDWAELADWQQQQWAESVLAHGGHVQAPLVETVSQMKSKAARWEWGAPYFEDGTITLLMPAERDASYWSVMAGSLSGFSPQLTRSRQGKRDPGDAFLSACRHLMGVDEGARGKPLTVLDFDHAASFLDG